MSLLRVRRLLSCLVVFAMIGAACNSSGDTAAQLTDPVVADAPVALSQVPQNLAMTTGEAGPDDGALGAPTPTDAVSLRTDSTGPAATEDILTESGLQARKIPAAGTGKPSKTPRPKPTKKPSKLPTATPVPTATSTSLPTATPTTLPTATPTQEPTATPTQAPTATPTPTSTVRPPTGSDYQQNLLKIQAQPWRNTNEDDSPYRDWTMQQLDADIENQLDNSKTDYFDGGFGEEWHSTEGWQKNDPSNAAMRTGCEFSHFAYDDPIVHPDQPERSHLHMFFGNTDVNAFSTWDTLWNSGGGTCNGNELNRTGYWAPAMFDQNGNVRIPDFINVYYKNDNLQIQIDQGFVMYAEPYPVAASDTWIDPSFEGARVDDFEGVQIVAMASQQDQRQRGSSVFRCINEYGGGLFDTGSLATLQCPDDLPFKSYLEMNVFFPSCWNGEDPSAWNTDNVGLAAGGFYWRDCAAAGYDHNFTGIQYRIRYTVEPGDDTRGWFLASDVDRDSLTRTKTPDESSHGDWWGAWNPTVNQLWIDNCGNVVNTACGYGYMDGQPYDLAPTGPTLRYREKYNTPGNEVNKVPAQDVYNALCSHARPLADTEQAAWCTAD